ncbi:MAG TPA: FAD-dependent monooxygenase, partial [Acidimicrobiia bacterium]|nr:FAD-dependent monooxygenase [Acidimicrobiia bacterium]
ADLRHDVVSTHALMRPAVMQLQRWGLLDAVVASGAPPIRSINFHYDGATVTVPVKPSNGIDALYAPRRTVLDPIVAAAAGDAGATTRFGAKLVGVLRSPSGSISGAEIVERSGRRRTVACRLLIGADGRNSTVARLCASPVTRVGRSAMAFAYAHVPAPPGESYEWHYVPGLTAGVIPTNADRACVFVGTSPERFDAQLRADPVDGFRRLLGEVAPAVAAAIDPYEPMQLRIFSGAVGFYRRCQGDGWALVGDAGYFKDPTTAHGITDAFLDAELLAAAVVASLGDSDDHALERYESERDVSTERLFDVTDEIAGLAWDIDRLRDLHLDLSAELSRESRLVAGGVSLVSER